jgi:hypothetical protein
VNVGAGLGIGSGISMMQQSSANKLLNDTSRNSSSPPAQNSLPQINIQQKSSQMQFQFPWQLLIGEIIVEKDESNNIHKLYKYIYIFLSIL